MCTDGVMGLAERDTFDAWLRGEQLPELEPPIDSREHRRRFAVLNGGEVRHA